MGIVYICTVYIILCELALLGLTCMMNHLTVHLNHAFYPTEVNQTPPNEMIIRMTCEFRLYRVRFLALRFDC